MLLLWHRCEEPCKHLYIEACIVSACLGVYFTNNSLTFTVLKSDISVVAESNQRRVSALLKRLSNHD